LDKEKAYSAKKGWSRIKETEFVEVWRKKEKDVAIHLIKSILKLPGVPVEDGLSALEGGIQVWN
jgi:hypothetical protein